MSNKEFVEAIAWLTAAIGRPIHDGSGPEANAQRKLRMDVYFECLGDLPIGAFRIACKRCALERKYQSFPPVAELRELATQTAAGTVKAMTGAEAFGLACKALARVDLDVKHTMQHYESLPPPVRAAVDAFGFNALYMLPNNAVETARAQFTKIFEAQAERQHKTELLPATVQRSLAAFANRQSAGRLEADRS